METPIPPLKPELLQDLFLLKREPAVAKVAAVFDGQLKELCLRTLFPKQVSGFISACLAQRDELEKGAGIRCFFVGDRVTWEELCRPEQAPNQILIAEPKLDFETVRNELLPLAREREHAVIYSQANPRPGRTDVVPLIEPREYEVRDVLKKHHIHDIDAERLARQSNGNIYLLTSLLTETSARPAWASDKAGFQLRCLAVLGGWDDASALDRTAVGEIVGQPYEGWVQQIYPLTKQEEPPVLLDGKKFKPVAHYETWQQLAPFLTDADINRFGIAALKVLQETAPELEMPKEERHLVGMREIPATYSQGLKEGLAETLALLGAKGRQLPVSANLAEGVARETVAGLMKGADWKRWASLSSVAPKLAEAAPSEFLDALDAALVKLDQSPLKEVFAARGDALFGRNYHAGLLWALEVLAWSSDHLNHVVTVLTRLAKFPLPENMGNNPLATLRGIFITWLPQTLASVEARKAAVECVIEEDPEIGWKLLLGILPEGHQVGHYNQKPHWRDSWFPAEWSEGVTRAEMYRQVKNYAELAVKLAMDDLGKLVELIDRWEHLPKEVFQSVLTYLESDAAKARPTAERFSLWEKLANEIDRHRKYAEADWAMPEEELQRLDKAAEAIKPVDSAVIHQRLFNDYDHHFFTGDDYDAQAKKVAQMRTDAVGQILHANGPNYFLEMAKAVKLPLDLGGALGRLGRVELDSLILPGLLETERPLFELMAGYVWARYHHATIDWVKSIDVSPWTPAQIGIFFARLPFKPEVWALAEARLGDHRGEYWRRIGPNPYQAQGHLRDAAQQSLDNGRPEVAVACLNAMRHLEEEVPAALAVAAVKQLVTNSDAIQRFEQRELLEVIKSIQEAPDAKEEDVYEIELQCLPLLGRFSGGRPVFLERRLANVPAFFHEVITVCFRSEQDAEKGIEPNPDKKAQAQHVFGLIYNWHTPPGTTRENTLDEAVFATWFTEVQALCEASGHWAIAQQMIGKALMYAPAGLVEILNLPVLAKTLNAPEHDHVRRGLRMEIFNSRGVHGFTGGKEELEIAQRYHEQATQYNLAKYPRIAQMLRSLAEGYEREAERDAKTDPYAD